MRRPSRASAEQPLSRSKASQHKQPYPLPPLAPSPGSFLRKLNSIAPIAISTFPLFHLKQIAHDEVTVAVLRNNGASTKVDVVQRQLHERGQPAQAREVSQSLDRIAGQPEMLPQKKRR